MKKSEGEKDEEKMEANELPAVNDSPPEPDYFAEQPEDAFDYDHADFNPDDEISWQASEYVHHHKDMSWFIILGVILALIAAGLFVVLNDITIVVLIAVMGAAVIVFANRKPRTLDYSLSSHGITIGGIQHQFGEFRSFTIMQEAGLFSVELDPLQRFRPATSIYFAPQDGDRIIEMLANFLPLEDREPDFIDRLIRKARF